MRKKVAYQFAPLDKVKLQKKKNESKLKSATPKEK